MRVEFRKGGYDSGFRHLAVVDRIDIILVNLVQDEVEFAPLSGLHVVEVLFLALCLDGKHCKIADDDSKHGDEYRVYPFHLQSTFSTSIPALRRRSMPSVRRYSSLYTTLLIPDWIISFEHSMHGDAVTYSVAP